MIGSTEPASELIVDANTDRIIIRITAVVITTAPVKTDMIIPMMPNLRPSRWSFFAFFAPLMETASPDIEAANVIEALTAAI